jgi:hypothetical protein
MLDPRDILSSIGVIAFSYPGREDGIDRICDSAFCGNDWPLEMSLEAPAEPGLPHTFESAEAAFHALLFWDRADEFASLSGEEARKKRQEFEGQENFQYAGFGSEWAGMLATLRAKFSPGSESAELLVSTGDNFLLFHHSAHSASGVDQIWSNSSNGEGKNWLGLQLMIVRDVLRQPAFLDERLNTSARWTKFLGTLIDLSTGQSRSGSFSPTSESWQDAVLAATQAILTVRLDSQAPT